MHRRCRPHSSAAAAVACLFVMMINCAPGLAADPVNPGAEGIMPDQETIIRKILGFDEMSKNVCLIDSHQMVNAADLPGRLVSISADRQVPSDLLRFSFRKPGAKTTTQVNPPNAPVQLTRLEGGQVKSGSLFNWFGASMSKEDLAEIRTVAMPATSISVDELDEQAITSRFANVSSDIRRGLGIITDVIPYELWASVCKKTTSKAESGIWYIKLGRDTYSRQSDEMRKYYLIAVYTPLTFYDDIGIMSGTKTSSIDLGNRKDQLSAWLKEQPITANVGALAAEHKIAWIDVPDLISPKPNGTTPGGEINFNTQDDPDTKKTNTSGGLTTVVPE